MTNMLTSIIALCATCTKQSTVGACDGAELTGCRYADIRVVRAETDEGERPREVVVVDRSDGLGYDVAEWWGTWGFSYIRQLESLADALAIARIVATWAPEDVGLVAIAGGRTAQWRD